jgi:uncharacterized protein YacL (UPF0231 family)
MQQVKKKGGRQSNKKDAIADWLNERIGSDPVLVDDLKAEAEDKKFSWRQVQYVANDQGIKKDRVDGVGGKYGWWREDEQDE